MKILRGEKMEPFKVEKPMIGMVHILPTPLSPENRGKWDVNTIIDKAVGDAKILVENGADGILVENYNDIPFYPDEVPPHTLTTMSIVVHEVVKEVSIPVGVNILRNACSQAIGVAGITGASFIRCNVLAGIMISNEGIVSGRAHEVIRYRDRLGKDTKIFADVLVKHAHSLVPMKRFEEVAIDTLDRGGANAIIVTGKRTGLPPSEPLVAMVMSMKEHRPKAKVIVGSGIRPNNIIYLNRYFDGFIVGTYFERFDPKKGWYELVPERIREIKNALE